MAIQDTIKAVLHIKAEGDATNAEQMMRSLGRTAQALGATTVKVTEQINTAAEKRLARVNARIKEVGDALQAVEAQRLSTEKRIKAAGAEKGRIDPKIVGSVQAITKANQAYVKSELDLTLAQRQRTDQMIRVNRLIDRERDAQEALLRTLQNKEATEDQIARAERNLELAQADLNQGHLKYDDLLKKIAVSEQARAGRLRELNQAQSAAGAQTNRVADAHYTLQAAYEKQAVATDRLKRAEVAYNNNPTKTNLKEKEVASRLLERAVSGVQRATDAYNKELDEHNRLQARSTQLADQMEADKKGLLQLDRQEAGLKRELNALEDKQIALDGQVLNATIKRTATQRQANTEWGKAALLYKGAGTTYLAAGRMFVAAGQQIVLSIRQYVSGIRQAVLATRQHINNMRQMGLIYRNSAGQIRLNTAALANMARAVISTTRAIGLLVKGSAQLAMAFGRTINAVRQLIGSFGRMTSIARSLGTGFATTGTHIGGIAVRLNAIQMGLFAAGGALIGFASKAKQAFGDALKVAGDFQQQLVTIKATLGPSGASYTEDIEKEAIRLGKKTMFDPQEAINVMTELIRGGKTADEVVNGTAEAVLNLAQATGEDLDTATKAVITSTTQWASDNLTAKESVDELTRAANASAATVEQLSGGLKNLGGVPSTLGVSHEDTLALLGALSEAGLRGPEGGTALRYFFLNLIPGTQKQIELMKELNLLTFNLGHAQEYLGETANVQAMNQEQLVQAIWEKWSGTKRLFQEAIEQNDPAVSRFQQWMARNQVITSQFVDQKTGELKDAATLMEVLWDKFGKLDPAARAKQISAIFGERGGSKGALNLLNAYETNLQKFQTKAKDSKGNLLSTDPNVVKNIRNEMKQLGDAQSIAQERTQTYAGSVERLGSNLQALKQAAMEPLLNGLAQLINKVSDIIGAFEGWMRANPEVTRTLGTIGLVLTGIASVMGPLTLLAAAFPYIIAGVKGLMFAMAPMSGIFLLVSALVSAVVVAFNDPSLGLGPVLKQTGSLFEYFGHMVGPILTSLVNDVIMPLGYAFALIFRELILPALNNFLQYLARAMPSAMGGFAGFVQNTLIPVLFHIAEFLAQAIPKAVMFLTDIWNYLLVPIFSGLADIWNTTLAPALGQFVEWLGGFMPTAINILAGIWTNVLQPIFEILATILVQFLLPILIQVAEWLGDVLPPVMQFLGDAIRQWVIPIIEKAATILGMLLPPIMNVVGAIIKFLIPVFKAIFDIVGPILMFLLDLVITVFNWIGVAIGWLAEQWNDGFLKPIRQAVEWVWDKIVEFWNNLMGFIDGIGKAIGEFFDWLTGRSGDAAAQTGQAIKDNLGEKLDETNTETKKDVESLAEKFRALQQPAGQAGHNVGFNFGFNLSKMLSSFMPEVQEKIRWYREQLQIMVNSRELMMRAEGGLGYREDVAALRRALGNLGGDTSIPFATSGSGSGPQNEEDTSDIFGDGNDGGNGNSPYDKQTDNRGGFGGGGGSSTRTAAEAAADEAKKVFDAIKAGVEAFRKISALVIPSNLEAQMQKFAEATALVVRKMADVARAYIDKEGKTPLLDAASAFAGTAEKAMGLIIKGLEAFKALEKYQKPSQDAIDSFLGVVKNIVAQVALAASEYTTEQLTMADLFADGASKSMDMLGKGLDAFASIRKFVKPATERIDALVGAVKYTMQKVGEIADSLSPELQEKATVYSETGAKVGDALKALIDMFVALDEKGVRKIEFRNLAGRVEELANALVQMTDSVIRAVGDRSAPEELATYLDAAQKGADAIVAFVDLSKALTEKGLKLASRDQIQRLIDGLIQTADDFSKGLADAHVSLEAESVEMLGVQAQIAESMAKIGDSLGSALSLMKDASEYAPGKADTHEVIKKVLIFMADFVSQFRVAQERFSAMMDEETAALAEMVGKAVDGLGGAIDTLTKLSEFTGVGEASVDSFLSSLEYIVAHMGPALNAIGEDMLEVAQSFGEKLGPAFDLMASALDLFKALMGEEEETTDDEGKVKSKVRGGFKPVDRSRVDLFIAGIQYIIERLRQELLQPGGIAQEFMDLAKEFGEKMGPAMDTMAQALDIFLKLAPDDEGKGGLKQIDPNAIGALVGNLYLLLHHWRNVVIGGEFQGDFPARSAAFSQVVGQVLEDMQHVLDLAVAIVEANEKGGAIDKLPENIQKMLQALRLASGVSIPELGDDFTTMFTGVNDEVLRQAQGQEPDTMYYRWGGKDPQKSLLYRMWLAVSGKAGFRYEIPLAFNGMFQVIGTSMEEWGGAFVRFWTSTLDTLKQAVISALGEIKSALEGFTSGTISVNVTVSGLNVPALASGGVVTRPTFALIGEGHEPEAVVPLSRAHSMGFGDGAGTTVKETNYYNIRQANVNQVSDLRKHNRRMRQLQNDRS